MSSSQSKRRFERVTSEISLSSGKTGKFKLLKMVEQFSAFNPKFVVGLAIFNQEYGKTRANGDKVRGAY